MKIYYPLLCYYPSQAGGPANTIYWLNEALAIKGFSCIVTSTFFGLKEEDVKSSKSVYHSKNKIKFVKGASGFFSLKEIKIILNSDVIHFSSLFFPPTIFILILGIIAKKKIIISPRGELYTDALNKSNRIKKLYLKIISVFISKIFFHATNEFELYQIKKIFPRNKGIFNLPNLIPITHNDIVHNNFEVLFLGRINIIKNIDKLIESIHVLKNKFEKKVILNIVGEARIASEKLYEKELFDLTKNLEIQDQINFLGQMNGSEKINILHKSCCLILPSKSENFGNVVIEALSNGTPVITSTGTPWQELENEGIGFWIEPQPDKIAEKINYFLNLENKIYQGIGKKAIEYVNGNFEISKNIYKWEKFYKKL